MNADYSLTHFAGPVDFSSAKFVRDANFSIVSFNTANFNGTRFHGDALFNGTQFHGNATFYFTLFAHGGNFTGAKFIEEATFFETNFLGNLASKLNEARYSSFNHAVFVQPARINFQVSDLSLVSFLNADVSQINFGPNIKWGDCDNNYKILEERLIENASHDYHLKDVSLSGILGIYRNLRENYEFRLRYDDAGEFFIRELEIKRKYQEIAAEADDTSKIKLKRRLVRYLSLTAFYHYSSKYGQSLLRPTAIGVGAVLGFTLLWFTQVNPLSDYPVTGFINLE